MAPAFVMLVVAVGLAYVLFKVTNWKRKSTYVRETVWAGTLG
jgi:hypothetical protein